MRITLIAASLAVVFGFSACVPGYEQHEIASIRAVGVFGQTASFPESVYRDIESTLDGLSAVFAKQGFTWPGRGWAQREGKRYQYGFYLTGERTYGISYVYQAVTDPIVQCSVLIDRKKVQLSFHEAESPRTSGLFPLPEQHRQHVRETARIVAEYLRRKLPSHQLQVIVDPNRPA